MMHSFRILLTPIVWSSVAVSTPYFLQSRATSCSTPSGDGTCVSTSACSGTSVSGYCPGAADIECCVVTCSTPSGNGYCDYTSDGCSGGTFFTGHCPGASDYQCCVAGSTPPSSGTGSPGLDVSGTPASSFWSCAVANYDVIAIEGYIQGCAQGGEVKSNFVSNYNSAKTAGFSRIDAYLFPCTGTQPAGVACKDPSTQLSEFLAAIDANGMTLGHLWFDIEPTSTANGDACNAWNLGASSNEALAKEWIAELQGSGRTWGIYANGNQWTTMFASRSTDIGSQLPLWAVQDDFTPGVNSVTTFMGGWTSAVAKQYNLGTSVCGQGVDLDSFL